ncbi:lysophospholipid acyltransferase family protein [candidate division KSB1 bacterium]|nr:lysophospholipid acyltransferase family protein [candidate division KSB1 bacterium]
MNSIDLKKIFEAKRPGYLARYPRFISNLILNVLERVLHIDEVNRFLKLAEDKHGFDFIDELFDYLDFGYLVSSKDKLKIPYEGRLVCVANHPLGALDGLALLKAISSVRRDVKIVANDVLMNLDDLKELFLPFDLFSKRTQKKHIEGIKEALSNEEAVIFFPAAEVSRLTMKGIRDKAWQNGPLYFARKYHSPVLPVFIKGKNSFFFYAASLLSKTFSMFLLVREIHKKRSKSVTLKIGDPIPDDMFTSKVINTKFHTRLLKRHVYRIGKNKPGIFKTDRTIIHPIDRKLLRDELAKAELLTVTSDNKKIYLVNFINGQNLVREIGRLREVTFRKVGEGTGNKLDIDEYDRYYQHVVIWDENEMEIIGSYRLGDATEIIPKYGPQGFYNASLFMFSDDFIPYLEKSLELGRSFIQQKYWRSNALDLLWQGIGAFLKNKPELKYLFGAVSISDNYSEYAKTLLVYFYNYYFGDPENLARSKHRFLLTKQEEEEAMQVVSGSNYEQDFRNLKFTLKTLGFSVPILFRRYTELCEGDGVKFLDFGIDESFSNTVDGLVFISLDKLKPSKQKRYFGIEFNSQPESPIGEMD